MSSDAQVFVRWEAQRRAAAGDRSSALELVGLIKTPDAATEILRGRILAQSGKFALAAEAYNAALKMDPANQEAKQGLALATSRVKWFRLHARRGLVILGFALALAGGAALWFRSVSNSDLAHSINALDNKVAASLATQQGDNRELAERISGLEQGLQQQAEASGQLDMQLQEELRRLQRQLAATATEKQLKAVQAEIVNLLKILESASGSSQEP